MTPITTYRQLRAEVKHLSREDLERLAINVFVSLHGVTSANRRGISIDPEKEWSGDTASEVDEDLTNAGLTVDSDTR